MLTGALKSLFAVAEAYPDLKANVNFQQLQSRASETEDKISYMRQSYNDTVMKYNTAIQTFPAVLFAGMMGFCAARELRCRRRFGRGSQGAVLADCLRLRVPRLHASRLCRNGVEIASGSRRQCGGCRNA